MFGRLKDDRRIAMRYDKNADNFMAGLCLAVFINYPKKSRSAVTVITADRDFFG